MSKAVIPAGTEKVVEAFHFVPGRIAGNFLFISGQLGTHNRVLAEGLEAQIDAAFGNLGRVLAEAGLDLGDIVEIGSFHVGDVSQHVQAFAAAMKRHLPGNPPAWTAVGVTGLAMAGALVEVKAVAALR
jgi:enamine deaminase RidA (YjgF/YER057c/UK114 family)